MASTIEEIETVIQQALATDFRGRLLDRGLARSMIWVDGNLPPGSTDFSDTLSYDLLSYGYSLLSLAIRLKELNGDAILCSNAFEKAATAINSVIYNGNSDDPEKGFHKVLAASAYHLGYFSAKAYSLLHDGIENENLSRMENMLSLLILRQFNDLENSISEWKELGLGSDDALAARLESEIDRVGEIGQRQLELPTG